MGKSISWLKPFAAVFVFTLAIFGSANPARADIPSNPPDNIFTIHWDGWGDSANNPITFTITTVSADSLSLAGYSNRTCLVNCIDPRMEIDPGGDESPFPQPGDMITITGGDSDAQSFRNTNSFDIHTLDFTVPVSSLPQGVNLEFSCDGTSFFACGFKVEDDKLEIRFSDTPEPDSWLLLLAVAVGVALKRLPLLVGRS